MGNLTCEKSHLEAEVNSNTGSHVAATIKSATYTNAAGEGCASTIPGVVKFTVKAMTSWCLTSVTAGSANLRNGACGNTGGRMKFLWSFAGSECEYQSKAEAINGTYASNTEPLTVALEEKAPFEKIRQAGFMCPEEMTLDAKYFIETPNGAKLKIS